MNSFINLETEEGANRYSNRFRNKSPAVYNHNRLREMPFPDNSLCNDNELNYSSSDSESSSLDNLDLSSTSNESTSVNSQRANSSNSNVASPMIADCVNNPLSPVDSAHSDDDNDELICLSPDVDFMAHSPLVPSHVHVKVDPISAHISFETKVN